MSSRLVEIESLQGIDVFLLQRYRMLHWPAFAINRKDDMDWVLPLGVGLTNPEFANRAKRTTASVDLGILDSLAMQYGRGRWQHDIRSLWQC